MWFWLSLAALLCWSGSDLFSKLGCRDASDRYAHLKMVTAVGAVMGLHACYEIFAEGTEISLAILWTYLPVSLLYIASMTLGYLGLRYIELSISSPVCNASGALVAVCALIYGGMDEVNGWQLFAVALVCVGVIGLGVVESREDEDLRRQRQEASNYVYAKSWVALALPLAYCLLDAAGTFADNFVVEKITTLTAAGAAALAEAEAAVSPEAAEAAEALAGDFGAASANVAYELTFLLMGLLAFVYVALIKKDRLVPKQELPKYAGAIFETAGQFAYIFAITDDEHLMFAAPIISAYCAASVLWSRLFLKERLSWKHYAMIALVVAGIVVLGLFDA